MLIPHCYYLSLLIIVCGRTTRITTHIEQYDIACSEEEPCHCYGRLCLVGSQTCSEGNVFIDGRPLCGVPGGWDKTFAGTMVCKELGFRNVIEVTSGG